MSGSASFQVNGHFALCHGSQKFDVNFKVVGLFCTQTLGEDVYVNVVDYFCCNGLKLVVAFKSVFSTLDGRNVAPTGYNRLSSINSKYKRSQVT